MIAAGLLLLLFAMSFKVSAVPFHFWTPDAYDGFTYRVHFLYGNHCKGGRFYCLHPVV